MAYTVKKLAQISGISIRTLHFYDQIGLLKPAFYGSNGYRHYDEEQFFLLQQILFFKEIGLELKEIQRIMGKGNFNKLAALSSHRQILQKNLVRTRKLIKTIDKTIEHLKGTKMMKNREIFWGFISQELRENAEQALKDRFGDQWKEAFIEHQNKVKNFTKENWEKMLHEFDEICKELVKLIKNGFKEDSDEVQKIIHRHYQWVNKFWTQTKESYEKWGQSCIDDAEKRTHLDSLYPKLADFFAAAVSVFAQQKLT